MEVGLGYFGWDVDQFWNATPREFSNAFRGWVKVREMDDRVEWERTRAMTLALVQVHIKKKLRPTDIFRFTWDDKAPQKRKPYGVK